jgi:hypothetical protein
MKRFCFFWLFPCLIAPFLLAQSKPASPSSQRAGGASDPKAQARILDSYGKLPLSFEANHGQTDSRVKFFTRAGGYSLFLTADEAVIALRGKAEPAAPKVASGFRGHAVSLKRYPDTNLSLLRSAGTNPSVNRYLDTNPSVAPASEKMTGGVLRMKLRGANPAASVTGVDELAGTSNYFIGNDPAKWRTGVPTYAKVKYAGIYSGIDLVYYGNQRQLEYDFIVAPGADPRRIAFDVRGASRIFRDAHGELVFKVGDGEVCWHRPVVYQEKDGARQLVAARYVVADGNRVGFELAKYDTSRALYIDPLVYSTYLGGGLDDFGSGIAVDSAGDAYVVGFTESADFPVTSGAFQTSLKGTSNAFVTKFNPTGSVLVYSTYVGGSNQDAGLGIAVDRAGNAYVIGSTFSTDFPVTPGAFQMTSGGGQDAFVTELDPSGSALVYSTYLGGGSFDSGYGIAVDAAGNAYVVGTTGSTNFPVTPGAFQTTCRNPNSCEDAFVTEINPSGSALIYSTYLGGSENTEGAGIALDGKGNAYVIGFTESIDFPVTPNAFQTTYGGYGDAFVAKLNPSGSALVYSTYLGGSGYDQGYSLAVDSAGNAYVTGSTSSTNFPVTPGAFQTTCNDDKRCAKYGDAFVAKLNPVGSALIYSSYLGGGYDDWGTGIVVDSEGNAYATGVTSSKNFPTTPGAFQTKCCHTRQENAFLTKINPTGSALVYSTYLGGSENTTGSGIAVDSAGNAYITGYTEAGFPTTPDAFQTTWGGVTDAFVTKIPVLAATTIVLSSSPNPSTYGEAVVFTAAVTSALGAPPDGEIITFMKGKTVLGTGTLSGGSASFTISTLKVGTHSITAVYGGDSNFSGSTSKAVKQVVNKAAN